MSVPMPVGPPAPADTPPAMQMYDLPPSFVTTDRAPGVATYAVVGAHGADTPITSVYTSAVTSSTPPTPNAAATNIDGTASLPVGCASPSVTAASCTAASPPYAVTSSRTIRRMYTATTVGRENRNVWLRPCESTTVPTDVPLVWMPPATFAHNAFHTS